VGDELARGFDLGWYGEYEARARGLEATLRPSVAGAGAFLDNLEAFWSGQLFAGFGGFRGLVATGVGYAVLWTFLLGGVVPRLAGAARGSFWATAVRNFPRFLALAVAAWSLYAAVYLLARRVFPWIEGMTRDVTAERAVLLWNLLAALVLVALLVAVRTAVDYARIALVLDERLGLARGALAGAAFLLRRPLVALTPLAAVALAGGAALAVYAWLAPVAGPGSALGVAVAFAWGQLAVAARIGLRLSLLGAEAAVFAAGAARPR
jgi:hypothetical protein